MCTPTFSRTSCAINAIASTSRLSTRSHSSSAAPFSPAFSPLGTTSASTEIPYATPSHPSAAYLPTHPTLKHTPSPVPARATGECPPLTVGQRGVLERLIRVDQAGELGANWIYRGQHAVVSLKSDQRTTDLIQDMWDGEKKHIAVFDKLVSQYGVRPTLMYPLWKAMGWTLGAGTAALGNRAAMACTEAVETVIGEHYDSQLKDLVEKEFPMDHPAIPLLAGILEEFRDDELGHLETAVENESQQAPAYALLSALIAGGCRAAIAVTERV